jgi:hypothetical protein
MNRTLLGICSLVLLVLAGITLASGPRDSTATSFAAGCLRVGLVLGAMWLALPQIHRILATTPRWLLVAMAIGLVVIVVRPILALVVIPALFALWILGPRLASKADPTIIRRRPKRRPPR